MGVTPMSLAEDAQKAAERQKAQSAKVAKATLTKMRRDHLTWVRERTGLDTAATFAEDRDLAVGEYHGETPVCVQREYPCYSLDGVIVAKVQRELYLVCTDTDLGEYLGPRVFTVVGRQMTKRQRRDALVQALATAMNTAAPHPLVVLREADATCPTCRRAW